MTDHEYNEVKYISGLYNIRTWAWIYSDILKREISVEEANETLERIWKENPQDGKIRWIDVTRSTEPLFKSER